MLPPPLWARSCSLHIRFGVRNPLLGPSTDTLNSRRPRLPGLVFPGVPRSEERWEMEELPRIHLLPGGSPDSDFKVF